ncbi:alpha/beta-hydrolase [Epithele typhae]|uniref:alpha/beta-hydrolase n=1 Tax=Epithele typhae TaxID=378194 RepID=UPI002007704E|nr:alpha/beta-hydrolase [Epithele typhae]KAH9913989.1 alpha/beta-hydrolase [Epithele typhae]
MRARLLAALVASAPLAAYAAIPASATPSSWPHDYSGKPSGDYSPAWQSYFAVTDALPGVNWTLPRSFAGNIGVNRAAHPNNTLFFWGFESENGSLTAAADERSSEPWGIWLNGGPGSSSMLGLVYENGPIHVDADSKPWENTYSWDKVADYFWIDQPVGVGWATSEPDGYVHDEDEVGTDFMGFLTNLVKVFPSLATRPLHLTGESYAGTYIPYIMKAYFQLENPPVKISKFAIGDGTIGSGVVFEEIPVLTIIETYPQLIAYNTEVFEYFREQEHLCGYDINLTYPQSGGLFPSFVYTDPTDLNRANFAQTRRASRRKLANLALDAATLATVADAKGLKRRTSEWIAEKRDLSDRANGTLDPWYGCYLLEELVDYAMNFSAPWMNVGNAANEQGWDMTQFAQLSMRHKQELGRINLLPFLGDPVNGWDPSVEPMAFLSELATNMSENDISVVLYMGNDDALIAHRGYEIVIQNTTFGGVQGFTRRPATPWYDEAGLSAGVVHQERNWTYILVEDAGHLIPYTNPSRALTLAREYIFGSNTTGLLLSSTGPDGFSVEGGEVAALAVDALRGQDGIYLGSISTTSTFVYPSATIEAWDRYIATATATLLAGSRQVTHKSLRGW